MSEAPSVQAPSTRETSSSRKRTWLLFSWMVAMAISMLGMTLSNQARESYRKQNEELRKMYNAEVKERNELKAHRDLDILAAGISGYMCGARGVAPEKFIAAMTNDFHIDASINVSTNDFGFSGSITVSTNDCPAGTNHSPVRSPQSEKPSRFEL